jgi:hypothetical protein
MWLNGMLNMSIACLLLACARALVAAPATAHQLVLAIPQFGQEGKLGAEQVLNSVGYIGAIRCLPGGAHEA